jgi:hypothetical protein
MSGGIKFGFGSKGKDDVETPEDLKAYIYEKWQIDHDPCPTTFSVESAQNVPDKERTVPDALKSEWGQRNFVNPPFSKIKPFFKKSIKESKKGKLSIFLVPARTGSKYWSKNVFPYASRIMFLRGGIKFQQYQKNSPFHLALIEIPPNAEEKETATSIRDDQGNEKYNFFEVVPK